MARIRCIKPEFWSSEQVVACSRDARLMFIGIWNFADDAGIFPAKCLTLKMQVYPGDPCTVEDIRRWVGELLANGLLILFRTDDGSEYWQVTGWHHQKIEKPSYKYPQPTKEPSGEGNSASSRRVVGEESSDATPRNGMDGKGEDRKGEDSSLPHAAETEIALEVVVGELVDEAAVPIIPDSRPRKATERQWEEFKAAYPRRAGGQEYPSGRKKLDSLIASGEDFDLILAGAGAYRMDRERANKIGTEFVKQMSTWLNRKCYLDEIDVGSPQGGLLDSRNVFLDAMSQVGGSNAIVRGRT